MPDAPQPVSKKRKANSEAASSSAPPPPEKKQRANSGRVSLAKSITTGTQLSTPSTRGPICPTAPASAPPRTKLCRSSVQQSAMTGPLTKSQLQPLRRRMRSSVTESSKKRADSSGMEDDTPPPVTALRRSSSGRIITSTPKIAAANEFGKPFGSAKTHLSRQKRKSLPVPPDIIELYSSEEDRRRGIKGKVPPVKKRKKRKAAEVIDLCSDDEPSHSPVKTPTVRARVHVNIVTVLSSDDDKPPMRLDEPRFSRTPFSSQKKEKSRIKMISGLHEEREPTFVAVSYSAARPLTQVDVYPKILSCPPTHTSANDQRSEPVIGDFDTPDARYDNTKTGYENDLASGLLGDVEGSVIMRNSSTTPTPEYLHDGEEFHSPVPQSLGEHDVNRNSGLLTHPDYHNLLDTDTLPPAKLLLVPASDAILSTSDPYTRVEFLERDITGNVLLEKRLENGTGVLPNLNATPLFLPPLDDEEQDVEAQGPQYTSLWKDGEDSRNASPSERNLVTKPYTTAQLPSTATKESIIRDGTPPALFLSSVQTNGSKVTEVGEVILIPSQHVSQSDNALTDIVPTISEGELVVAMYGGAKDVNVHPLVEEEGSVEKKEEQVKEDFSKMGLSGTSLKECERNSASPTREGGHDKSRDARVVELNTAPHPSGGTQNSNTKQLEGVHPAGFITISPQLIRLSSPSEGDIDESVSLPSPTFYHHWLEKTYAEEVSRCRYQLLHWTPSYANPNITYPSDPSTLLSQLRLHTPGFFSQSFISPPPAEEKKVFVEDQQEQNNIVITQPMMITHFTSSEPTTVEVFIASSRSVDNAGTPTRNIAISSIITASPSPGSLSQAQEEAQVDAILLEQESYSESTPAPEGEDEVIAQVTTEFLENDPTLASALLESKMFMDILRDVQQEDSDGGTRISDEPTRAPTEAPDEYTSPPRDPTYFSKSVPSPENTQIGTLVLEHIQYGHDQPLISEQPTHLEHRSPLSPSSLISSSTLQDSPLPHTPKVEERAVTDADIFYICSESPSAFNPDAFAAILDVASPPPLAKEEDDYFSTHFFDYPDDLVA